MPRYKPDPLGRSCLLYPSSKLQQEWHCSFLHHKSVDSLNACIILTGPIQVLSGIVILKKYFVSVGIQVFVV